MFIFLLQLPSEYIFMKIVLIFIVTIGPYVFTYVHRLGSKFRIWIRKLFMERSDSKYFRVSGLYAAAAAAVASVVSDSVRPHRRQPTRLPRPWDSPGKNTGVGCHFLLQCMKVKSLSEIAQLCLTLHDPMDYSLPGSSIHGIFQAKVL